MNTSLTKTLKGQSPLPLGQEDHLALFLNTELETMRDRWIDLSETTQPCPIWSWEQIGEALLDLTSSPVEELVMRGALSGLVKQAAFKPQDLVLSEILRLAIAARDHGFGAAARDMLEDDRRAPLRHNRHPVRVGDRLRIDPDRPSHAVGASAGRTPLIHDHPHSS
jgi:hypothetical protein